MLSVQLSKQFFINALKANKNTLTYVSTMLALMLTLLIHGLFQGNLKPEYFGYALIVSCAFYLWDVIDHKSRKQSKLSDH